MGKKYKLTDETIYWDNKKLYRIKALKNFSDVRKGDIGGFVESEKNLSQKDYCWIYNEAKVFDDAKVKNHAIVTNNAIINGNAVIRDCSMVTDNAKVTNNAIIADDARIWDKAEICGNAKVIKHAVIANKAIVAGNAKITDYAKIVDSAKINGNAVIKDSATVSDKTWVTDNVIVGKKVVVKGCCDLKGDAKILSSKDYIIFKNWWSSDRFFIWTRSNDMWSVGCFFGTGKELINKAYCDSKLSGQEYERIVKYVESIKK